MARVKGIYLGRLELGSKVYKERVLHLNYTQALGHDFETVDARIYLLAHLPVRTLAQREILC